MTSFSALTPARALVADDPVEIVKFAVDAFGRGSAAIATLTEIRGGAARALESQIVMAEDGVFCGYVSGGCVEAAVAAEALSAMSHDRDRRSPSERDLNAWTLSCPAASAPHGVNTCSEERRLSRRSVRSFCGGAKRLAFCILPRYNGFKSRSRPLERNGQASGFTLSIGPKRA
ncbi:XdhC family protein [Rhizobium calliandrae]|uniref:XdhC family protein n=1 Tax=Rhizobium calliandrae TaxID=1312182 RepID=UPI0032E4467C